MVTKKSQLEICGMQSLDFFFTPKLHCQAIVDVSIKVILYNNFLECGGFFISQFYLADEEKGLWACFAFGV